MDRPNPASPPVAPPAGADETIKNRLIVALDYPDTEQALSLVERLEDTVRWYKVGLELYLSAGNTIVQTLVRHGYCVFLDLKLHDIPNTVAGAVRAANHSGASLLTIHAAGGPAMIEAACNAAASLPRPPKILAVTVLTSMDAQQMSSTGVSGTPAAQVKRLAALAITSGADGLVCSPEEAGILRQKLGEGPILVTPGIRPLGVAAGDQHRIATPETALRNGASYIVVGRPITQADDPRVATEAILAEMAKAGTRGHIQKAQPTD